MTNEELNSVMAKAKEQFRKSEPFFGKNGAFHFMLENLLNTALETEMDEHLAENKGNGHKDRRNGKKRKTILAEGLSDKISSLYATGQSTRDISKFIEDNYGSSISAETISHITDRVWPEIQSWRSRSLENVYPIVWLDAIHYKVKDEKGAVVSRAIYNVLGVDRYGLKNRGVKDILIACVD